MLRHALLQPRRYQADQRQLAAHRKQVFLDPPGRRNRVWQADITKFETSRGGPGGSSSSSTTRRRSA
jgi:hypothetical protein